MAFVAPSEIEQYYLKCIKTENIFLLLLQDKKAYLDVIHTYMEVHGTVHGTSTIYIPGYVKNHGILSGRDLQFLLRETKVSLARGNVGKSSNRQTVSEVHAFQWKALEK